MSIFRNGLAFTVVGAYVLGWLSYGYGWWKVEVPVQVGDEVGNADISVPFLMSIIPFVMLILTFYFRKKPANESS